MSANLDFAPRASRFDGRKRTLRTPRDTMDARDALDA